METANFISSSFYSLRIQSLTHYSDFDGTSESETSEISIVLPYASRFRGKKQSQPAEGQIRQKKGARAIRRYENGSRLFPSRPCFFESCNFRPHFYRRLSEHPCYDHRG